jgi:hypothetical protein
MGGVVRDNGVVADIRRSPRLTADEVAVVLRRAAEIEAASEAPGGDGQLDAAAVEEAAQEAGLSPVAVRQAVAELQVGALPVAPPPSGGLAASRFVAEQRLVDADAENVHATIKRFMRSQMFQQRRRSGDRAVYRPRSDLVASLRRGLDFAGAIRLDGLRTVSVLTTPADERTLVRIEAELVSSRATVVGVAATAGTGVTLATGVGGVLLGEPALVVASLPAGAAVGAGGLRVAGARWQRRRDDVAEVLAHLLDRL